MKNSLQTTARWSSLALAMGIMSIPAFQAQAQAAINWPGGTGDKNKNVEFQQGWDAGQQDCRDAPQPCGVKIYPMTKDQGYGETEPNDHILNADGLLLGQFYHGNTLGEFDRDWYYVITDIPNQKLTLYFLGDAQDFSRMVGWLIQVRDLNGNLIAEFNSDAEGSDSGGGTPTPVGGDAGENENISPLDAAKITEVTLGKVGTYYISVKHWDRKPLKSRVDDGTYRGYNIAATLENTGQVTGNPDDNRFDTETEPNDDKAHADPLRSNVAMTGVFDRTLIKRIEVTNAPEYVYWYKGCTPEKLNDSNNTVWFGFNNNSCECDITTNPGPVSPQHPDPSNVNPPFQTPPPNTPAEEACFAKQSKPAETKYVGIFAYDTDTYVYHSEGNEQLRIQLCTRTDCQFDKVHLRVNKDNTSIVLMESPIEPGQTIDLGAALQGDYYFEFTAEETGVISDTGDSQVSELLGPYDLLLMSTKFSPHGN